MPYDLNIKLTQIVGDFIIVSRDTGRVFCSSDVLHQGSAGRSAMAPVHILTHLDAAKYN